MHLSARTHLLLPSPHTCVSFKLQQIGDLNAGSDHQKGALIFGRVLMPGAQPVAFETSTHLWYKWPGSNDLGIMKQLDATISPPFWRRKWQPTPGSLPGESHGQRNLAGYSPRGHRVRHNWVTEHACTHHLFNIFFLIFIQFLMDTFHLQFFQNICCVV